MAQTYQKHPAGATPAGIANDQCSATRPSRGHDGNQSREGRVRCSAWIGDVGVKRLLRINSTSYPTRQVHPSSGRPGSSQYETPRQPEKSETTAPPTPEFLMRRANQQ